MNYKIFGKDIMGDTSVAIGFFDGVHIGHQEVFEKLKEVANNTQTVAITFNPHPIEIINKELSPKLIQTLNQRINKILSLGIDTVIVVKFNKEMANMPYEEFVCDYLIEKLKVKNIVTGFNFTFGKNRQGNKNTLSELGKKLNYNYYCVPPKNYDEFPVSSTRVRSLIYEGHMTVAKNLLGEYFTLFGIVEKGRQVGREIGFPTANLSVGENQIIPAWGVYVTYAEINGKKYYAGCNIGIKPTFGLNYVTIEAHFIDDGEDLQNLYDKEINLVFVKKIRDEIQFQSPEALSQRIKKDIEIVNSYKMKG